MERILERIFRRLIAALLPGFHLSRNAPKGMTRRRRRTSPAEIRAVLDSALTEKYPVPGE